MPESAVASFQQALEMVEGLPEEQQQDLVEIIRSRQRERRREILAASIEQARQELARGEARRGSVDDLMADIDE
jgi:acyl-CoA reductase-like NAD-dependent aldehyde dehydrogenase